jgi:hypothetical protein
MPVFASPGRAALETLPPVLTPTPFYKGRVRNIVANVAVPNGFVQDDRIFFGKVPAMAVINPASLVYFGAFGSGITLDIGDINDPDGLATTINVASAGNSPILEAMAASNFVRPLWQHLGYAANPNRELDLFASVRGGNLAVSTAFLTFNLLYSVD